MDVGASGLGDSGLRSGSSNSSVSDGYCLSTATTTGSFHHEAVLPLATLMVDLPISMSVRAKWLVGGGVVGRNVGLLVFISSGQLFGYGAVVDFGSSSGNALVR